jgi:hypothetical protein
VQDLQEHNKKCVVNDNQIKKYILSDVCNTLYTLLQ